MDASEKKAKIEEAITLLNRIGQKLTRAHYEQVERWIDEEEDRDKRVLRRVYAALKYHHTKQPSTPTDVTPA